MAGTIAAQDNGNGVVGVAPQASLHIVRFFDDSGSLAASNLIVAMNACADANANIISMSYGGFNVSRVYNLCFYTLSTSFRTYLTEYTFLSTAYHG